MIYNLRKALAFLFILGMGFSLIGVVFAQSGQHAQIYVPSSYGTWLGQHPYYFHYPDYSYLTGYYPYYYPYYPYDYSYYNPYYRGGVEMQPGEATAEWLFYHGIGEPWVGGDPPHSRWSR
ncbi:MAG: hypothetical protein LUQ38_07615 [Methanotrichaceae archaeon]|nr:hypothetical protein [Methanotrichaceae archaeon]